MTNQRHFVSFKTKIIVTTIIPIVLSYMLISSVILVSLFNSYHETARAEFSLIGQKYSASFEGKISNAMNYLSIIASILEMQIETDSVDREALRETVFNIFSDYELLDGSSVYFESNMYDGMDAAYRGSEYGTVTSGRICYYFYKDNDVTTYLPEGLENDIEFELPHYTEAKELNKPVYTEPVIYNISGRDIPMFTLTYPVRNSVGNFIGAVTVDLFLEDIYTQLQNEKIYETGYIIITNQNDRIIYSPVFDDIGKSREEAGVYYTLPSENETSAFSNSKSILNNKASFVTTTSVYINRLDSFFYVSVAAPLSEINAVGMNLITVLVTFSIIIIASIALLMYYLISKISAPIKELTENANKIANGQISEASAFVLKDRNVKNIDEIYILFSAIQKMFSQLNEIQQLKLEALESEHKREKAEAQAQAKGDFLARMSHEIRTPMNAIIGITELVLREKLPPKINEHVLGIKNASNNLLSLINDILDFSKIESGKLEIISTEYMFASLINDVINIIRVKASEKPIFFVVNLDSAIPNRLIGDEARIRQILINLLSNAFKYTHEGYISMTITSDMQDDNSVLLRIDITDSGIGIKPADLEKLFHNFIQVDIVSNRGVQGTGLGLSIAKSLSIAMGGDISVRSEYGRGSTFTMLLPQKFGEYERFAFVTEPSEKKVLLYEPRDVYADSIVCSLDNLGVESALSHTHDEFYEALKAFCYPFVFASSLLFKDAKDIINELGIDTTLVLLAEYGEIVSEESIKTIALPAHSISIANILNDVTDNAGYGGSEDVNIGFSAPSARVLLVDDIPTNLRVAEGLMAPYNMRIDSCTSGEQSIQMVKANIYDIIFMDHMMPGMDGIEATRLIRAIKGDYFTSVPIVALTANAILGVKEMFLQNGMNDFLAKPIEMSKLNSILEKWIPRDKKKTADVVKHKTSSTLPEIEGMDIKSGITATGGDVNRYITTLSYFHDDGEEKITQIKACIENMDIRLYTTYVHALKSSMAIIGAKELSELAKNLEEAGHNNDTDYIIQNTERFLSGLEALIKNIGKAVSKARDKTGAKKTIDKSLLIRLKTALDEMDAVSISDIINQLQSQNLDAELLDQVQNINKNILMFEYDEAQLIIDKLLL